MRVRITLSNGGTQIGILSGHDKEFQTLPAKEAIDWVMNNDRKFILFTQPGGKEVLMNKNAISMVIEDA